MSGIRCSATHALERHSELRSILRSTGTSGSRPDASVNLIDIFRKANIFGLTKGRDLIFLQYRLCRSKSRCSLWR
jgi:hypothetical protein